MRAAEISGGRGVPTSGSPRSPCSRPAVSCDVAAVAAVPSSADIERAAEFAREPFLLDGEGPEALAPGTARRRALDAALNELDDGAEYPSIEWRRDFSLLLGLERILADDFLGVDPDGNLYEKAKMVADTREAPKEFISNHLTDVKVRFFGDTAVAQGNESWVRRTGTPLRARFIWTDTWILRNGAWQIVASEDLIAPEPAQKPMN